MRLLIQRVVRAAVTVEGAVVGSIGPGALLFLGVGRDDEPEDAAYLASRVARLRIFEDTEGKMNLDIRQAGGAFLVVSQFTLCADTRKGNRPGYSRAADPDKAQDLYLYFNSLLRVDGFQVETGRFRADMQVELVNDGPVTLWLDSPRERHA